MGGDKSGTSNLIAFPCKAADSAADAPSALPRDRHLIRRLETIATMLGVPVATFLNAAQERAAATTSEPAGRANARLSESAELLQLFDRISDGQTRDYCLNLLRMLAANEPDAGR